MVKKGFQLRFPQQNQSIDEKAMTKRLQIRATHPVFARSRAVTVQTNVLCPWGPYHIDH